MNQADENNKTPLVYAVFHRKSHYAHEIYEKMAQILLAHGSQLELEDKSELNPMDLALIYKSYSLVKLFRDNFSAKINYIQDAMNSGLKSLQILFKDKTDFDLVDKDLSIKK